MTASLATGYSLVLKDIPPLLHPLCHTSAKYCLQTQIKEVSGRSAEPKKVRVW